MFNRLNNLFNLNRLKISFSRVWSTKKRTACITLVNCKPVSQNSSYFSEQFPVQLEPNNGPFLSLTQLK